MKQIYRNIKELIGETPILHLQNIDILTKAHLYAKLEYTNPGGSVKDRLGMALIKHGEQTGQLKPGGVIIEPTAGNTGIGLALAAIGTEYQVIFVVPEQFSQEKQMLMRALGAKVINTPTELGIKGAIAKSQQLANEMTDAYCPQQFSNPANPQIHYEETGPELWQQLHGEIDVFVAGAGSAGTFMGVARFLKEQNPHIRCVIVEPEGSIIAGGKVAPHKTEGIGMEQIPDFFNWNYVDEVYSVADVDAFNGVKKLALQEGLLVGSSSGAAYHAAVLEAQKVSKECHIITIFPDGSERYLSKKIYEGGM